MHLPFSHVILEKNLCGLGPRKQVKCDDLQGWDRGGGQIADSYSCTAEINTL